VSVRKYKKRGMTSLPSAGISTNSFRASTDGGKRQRRMKRCCVGSLCPKLVLREHPAREEASAEREGAELLELISQHPDGLTADQINQSLHATDKKDKQAIANLLANMKKEGALHQEQRRGSYVVPAEKVTLYACR
jgi:hypothetical protein